MALGTAKGFGVTFKHIFKRPITQEYPEYKRPVYPRFRGRHRLHRFENGLEKCVGCSLCAGACPADCIRVVPAETRLSGVFSAGTTRMQSAGHAPAQSEQPTHFSRPFAWR